jgi:hypothetical protein
MTMRVASFPASSQPCTAIIATLIRSAALPCIGEKLVSGLTFRHGLNGIRPNKAEVVW